MLARQYQRRALVASREDKERCAERRHRFESHRAAGFKAGEDASADALVAGTPRQGQFTFDRLGPLHAAVAALKASMAVGSGVGRAGGTRRCSSRACGKQHDRR